jgi:hypothetical protein
VTARHLINLQRITRRRENTQFHRFDTSLYLDESLDEAAILERYHRNA